MQVERLSGAGGVGRDEWDEFVAHAPDATFFHRAAWRDVLEETFAFRSHFLAVRRGTAVAGVLPLCELRPLFGRPRLLSLPLAVEAGVSAADDEARGALDDAVIALARDLGAGHVELRDGLGGERFRLQPHVYSRFRRRLSASEAENYGRIPRRRRRMIRLGQQSGLRARLDAGLDVFYDLFARSQRRLGTPVLPRRYFDRLLAHFGDESIILTVWRGDTAVAGVLSFLFRRRMMPYYAGSRAEYFRYGINDFMYWELMRLACRRGLECFDFGRSRVGSGAFEFKRHWGFEPEPLRYRIQGAARARDLDAAGVRLLRWGWRHLPLPLTKAIGPRIALRFAPYFT